MNQKSSSWEHYRDCLREGTPNDLEEFFEKESARLIKMCRTSLRNKKIYNDDFIEPHELFSELFIRIITTSKIKEDAKVEAFIYNKLNSIVVEKIRQFQTKKRGANATQPLDNEMRDQGEPSGAFPLGFQEKLTVALTGGPEEELPLRIQAMKLFLSFQEGKTRARQKNFRVKNPKSKEEKEELIRHATAFTHAYTDVDWKEYELYPGHVARKLTQRYLLENHDSGDDVSMLDLCFFIVRELKKILNVRNQGEQNSSIFRATYFLEACATLRTNHPIEALVLYMKHQGYSVQAIAEELKIKPNHARRLLDTAQQELDENLPQILKPLKNRSESQKKRRLTKKEDRHFQLGPDEKEG